MICFLKINNPIYVFKDKVIFLTVRWLFTFKMFYQLKGLPWIKNSNILQNIPIFLTTDFWNQEKYILLRVSYHSTCFAHAIPPPHYRPSTLHSLTACGLPPPGAGLKQLTSFWKLSQCLGSQSFVLF